MDVAAFVVLGGFAVYWTSSARQTGIGRVVRKLFARALEEEKAGNDKVALRDYCRALEALDSPVPSARFELHVRIADTAIRGHNNERFDGVTVEQCEELCCARDWCKSFDYTSTAPMHYNLADIDATRNFGDTTRAVRGILIFWFCRVCLAHLVSKLYIVRL